VQGSPPIKRSAPGTTRTCGHRLRSSPTYDELVWPNHFEARDTNDGVSALPQWIELDLRLTGLQERPVVLPFAPWISTQAATRRSCGFGSPPRHPMVSMATTASFEVTPLISGWVALARVPEGLWSWASRCCSRPTIFRCPGRSPSLPLVCLVTSPFAVRSRGTSERPAVTRCLAMTIDEGVCSTARRYFTNELVLSSRPPIRILPP
jgi:hypothetical protein